MLRTRQEAGYRRVLETGSILVTANPQTGKTILCLEALASLKGPRRSRR